MGVGKRNRALRPAKATSGPTSTCSTPSCNRLRCIKCADRFRHQLDSGCTRVRVCFKPRTLGCPERDRSRRSPTRHGHLHHLPIPHRIECCCIFDPPRFLSFGVVRFTGAGWHVLEPLGGRSAGGRQPRRDPRTRRVPVWRQLRPGIMQDHPVLPEPGLQHGLHGTLAVHAASPPIRSGGGGASDRLARCTQHVQVQPRPILCGQPSRVRPPRRRAPGLQPQPRSVPPRPPAPPPPHAVSARSPL